MDILHIIYKPIINKTLLKPDEDYQGCIKGNTNALVQNGYHIGLNRLSKLKRNPIFNLIKFLNWR